MLNDQGGNRMDVTEEVTCTLRAEAHHPPVVLDGETQSAGFCTEHSAKSRGIGYEEEMSPTLRAGVVPAAVTKDVIALEHHPTDSRIGIEEGDAIQTLTSRMGTGGNNVPLIMTPAGPLVPKTLKIRSGCLGGGKGALVQEDLSATLGCNNDQTVFVPVEGCNWDGAQTAPTLTANNADGRQHMPDKDNMNCVVQPVAYGISSMDSNGMKSANPKVGFYEADTSKTLDVSGGNPSCNQGGIAVVAIEGNGSRPSHKGDGYKQTDAMYTLNATEQHGVAYGIDRAAFNQGQNAKFGFQIEEEVEPTMVSRGPNAVDCMEKGAETGENDLKKGAEVGSAYSMTTGSFMQVNREKTSTLAARDFKDPPIVNDSAYGFYPMQKAEGMTLSEEVSGTLVNGTNPGYQNGVVEPYYIVRRLTPTECARLQGFPDWWCSDLAIEEPTEEDVRFWADIWETHRKVVGGSSKPKTEKQLIKWLKDPHSDAAEYKLWGNGVALPCVYFVLSGIAWAAQKGDI